eukprot:COSAG02_NODE_29872_length_561_cov_0.993506_1_plen_64_part_00
MPVATHVRKQKSEMREADGALVVVVQLVVVQLVVVQLVVVALRWSWRSRAQVVQSRWALLALG